MFFRLFARIVPTTRLMLIDWCVGNNCKLLLLLLMLKSDMSSVWHMSDNWEWLCGSPTTKHYEAVTKHLHNYEPLVSCVRERTLPRCVAGQLEAACRGGNCKTRNKRISISYPKQQQAKGLPSSHTWRNQKRSQLDRATWGPPFPFFHYFGTLSLTLMIIITESIDASVGAAFFYRGFSFLSLALCVWGSFHS